MVAGLILLKSNSDVKHDGIFLTMEGSVNLQLSSKNVGIFEAFYNSVKVSTYLFYNELTKSPLDLLLIAQLMFYKFQIKPIFLQFTQLIYYIRFLDINLIDSKKI